MSRLPLVIVARGFRISGLILGALALIALAVVVPDIFMMRQAGTIAPSHNLDIEQYGLAGLLQNAGNGVAGVLGIFVRAAVWLLVLFAILDAGFVAFAAVVYVTGRGLERRATWARIAAVLLALLILLAFLPAAGWAVHEALPVLGLIVAVPLAAALYALWALIWRFAPAGN